MKLIILLTILLIAILLGGLFLQRIKIWSFVSEQITITADIKIKHLYHFSLGAVKHAERNLYLLNNITPYYTQKGAQAPLTYTKFPSFPC
ncbi:hypothetical protein [Falsiporphyromonas endometrii]|uniref:Uncharacterized protein n=1 Tax=Falsiporphyromonas endometrii TaxID=1387297 RepID=A0ABV9K8A1_9PORP